jgi:hypothetical protein
MSVSLVLSREDFFKNNLSTLKMKRKQIGMDEGPRVYS